MVLSSNIVIPLCMIGCCQMLLCVCNVASNLNHEYYNALKPLINELIEWSGCLLKPIVR